MKAEYTYNEDGEATYTASMEDSDTWNADILMSHLITSVMREYRGQHHQLTSVFPTHIDDVPEHLREDWKSCQVEDTPLDTSWSFCPSVCDYILDEIIHAFDPEYDYPVGADAGTTRQDKGRMLFAKYFHSFWT